MIFKIQKEICEVGSGIYSGVVVAYNLDNSTENVGISELLQKEGKEIASKFSSSSLKNNEIFSLYREAMKRMEINPSKYPCSVEALVKRIVRDGGVSLFSPVLNLANYISIKHKVPVGVHDIDSLEGGLNLRLAKGNELNIEKDSIVAGEPIYVSGDSVRTRRWFWRQTAEGRVNENSKNFLFVIDGFTDNMMTIDNACNELVELLSDYFKTTATVEKISSDNLEFAFGILTEEEKEIENEMAIMLKGVVQSTASSEIRNRLISAKKNARPLRIKLGLDPSAPDIHIGHSVVLRKIKQLQNLGHTAVIIIGDYTGMIGDPTGKSKTRRQLTKEEVKENAETYLKQIFKIIDKSHTEVYYNSEWFSKMEFADMIELASKCTVARMLERDDFNNRYTNHLPLSVHEFFYPLMQAYDSVAVRADVELGGTDQTFNILMGRNIQRDYGQEPQLTLFMPLLEGTDGKEKMSKSLGNYIGISESPVVIFEKVMKIPDNLIIKYYNLCTDLHPLEVQKIQNDLLNGVNPRDIKMMLAYEITMLYYSKEDAEYAKEHFKLVFQKDKVPEDAPVIYIDIHSIVPQGEQIIDTLVSKGIFSSKSEMRRLFAQGGVKMDGVQIRDPKSIILDEKEHILKLGKAKFFRVVDNFIN